GKIVADMRALFRLESEPGAQQLPGFELVLDTLDHAGDAERRRALRHRGRTATGDPGDDNARALEPLHSQPVQARVGLELAAVFGDVDATIGQHTVDVAGQQPDAARSCGEIGRGYHTTLARKRSCRCNAPTSRSSASTTRSCVTFGAVSINSTQSIASRSGPIVRGWRVIRPATPSAPKSRTRARQRRRSPSVKMPSTRFSASITAVMPMPLPLISTTASASVAASGTA